MNQNTYYMDKRTGTVADALAAYGLAAVLDRLLQQNLDNGLLTQHEVVMRDLGPCYAIELSHPIQEAWLEGDVYFNLLPFIETSVSRRYKPEGVQNVVDYDAERQRNAMYFELRRNLPSELRRRDAPDDHPLIHEMNQYKPRLEWPIWAAINQMSAIYAYSKVIAWWVENREYAGELLRVILQMSQTSPNNVDEALTNWKALKKEHDLSGSDTVTMVQVTNPAAGKGANRAKADALTIGGLNEFWLLELLKMVGLYEAGLPLRVRSATGGGRPPKDRKTYVLLPLEIGLREHRDVFGRFRETFYSQSAIKMDVLAALRYTRTFLEYCEANRDSSLAARLFGRGPQQIVAGLGTVFYKDLGNAVAVMNQSQLNLPGWVRVRTAEDVHSYMLALDEHADVIGNLDESHGDAYELLRLYRDFLSGRDLAPLYEFTARYAAYVMGQMERGRWAPRFTTDNLRRVIVGTEAKLKTIIEDTGFLNIARAIRRSTVIPQYFKARNQRGPYEVRYGLGAALLREAAYPDRFVQELSEFLHEYNRETAQIDERFKGNPPVRRAQVTTEDISRVLALMDEFGSQTVANLLVAFGYARELRDQDQEPEAGERLAGDEDMEVDLDE